MKVIDVDVAQSFNDDPHVALRLCASQACAFVFFKAPDRVLLIRQSRQGERSAEPMAGVATLSASL